MRNKVWKWIIIILLFIPLTGCWDQRLLKQNRLVYGSAFDLTDEKKVRTTAVIRDFKAGAPTNTIVTATGNTIRDTRIKLNRQVSGTFAPSKNRIFLLGTDVAKEDIYTFLDIFYRDPNSSISSKIAVVKGNAGEILQLVQVGNVLVAEYLIELITSEEKSTTVPIENVQSICTPMFDIGKDFALPAIKLKGKEVMVDGVSLFHNKALSGSLTPSESTLYLLFADKKSNTAQFVTKIEKKHKLDLNNYITYNVLSAKPKYTFDFSSGSMVVNFNLKLDVSIAEYPKDKLASPKVIKKLEKKISEKLTLKSKKVMKKLQKANCDIFGFGRELIAYHPEKWKKMDWEKDYSKIKINPKVEVEIVGTGILN